MGLFDKIKEPVFLKDDSAAQRELTELQELRATASGDLAERLDEEIRRVDAGIYGEQTVRYELANSHIPMFVLHDLFLEQEGLSAQIDYLIITRKHVFVVECKNLYGNIEITNGGDFIRTISYGRRTRKEGIYSPITQNRRHLELIKQIRASEKGNILSKALFEKNFYENYRSIVVLANPKTVLFDRYAKKEIREQVIKADQLAENIRKTDGDPKAAAKSEKDMEATAQFFYRMRKEPSTDYIEKFRAELSMRAEAPEGVKASLKAEAPVEILCPKCGAPMVKRKAAKGANAGKEFYGCSNFPKCRGIVNIK